MKEDAFRRVFVIVLVLLISVGFLAMVWRFLLTILLAAIASGLAQPLYRRLVTLFRGRRTAASLCTLLILFVLIVGPLLGFLGALASQAVQISQAAGPWIEERIQEPDRVFEFLRSVPGADRLEPYREEILKKTGQLVGTVGNFLVGSLSTTTRRTVSFFFHVFLLLYAMYFFLKDGRRILDKILYYIPLSDEDESRMVDKFLSVSRATLKGTLIIGIVQGSLAGAAFAVAGLHGALFWGTIMTVLSIIPGVGAALVWVPAVVYLIATDHVVKGLLLAAFCVGVVGTADNFLRPRLIGKDVKMHDLMILLGTLGGLLLFGVVGFVVGPILAALFVTIWEIYGVVFAGVLPRSSQSGD